MIVQNEKQKIRREIRSIKGNQCQQEMREISAEILSRLESLSEYTEAKNILLYHSLPDEVDTTGFIRKWEGKKNILLPVVEKDELLIRRYKPENISKGSFGIYEPQGENITDLSQIELAIIPGVAFDRCMNRLGRGKGYYDKLLVKTTALRIGICFDFQLRDHIPAEPFDCLMDIIITRDEIIRTKKK